MTEVSDTPLTTPARRPRVLMLTHRVPCPPDRGDRIRSYNLLRTIAEPFDVTVASTVEEPFTEKTRAELDRLTTRFVYAHDRPMRRRINAIKALVTGRAMTPAAKLNPALVRQIVELHRQEPFDTVLTFCTGMIRYAEELAAASPGRAFRHVVDLVDVDSAKWASFAETTRGPMRLIFQAEARRLRAVEAGRVVPFDAVSLISEGEAEVYRKRTGSEHEPAVIGNGVDLERFSPANDPGDRGPVLVFTGVMSYKPNIDAVTWFAERVMPRVLESIPEARFDIVGKTPSPEVVALGQRPGVRVVGPVDDTADSLRGSALSVAPMLIAPGVQNKVLEAMACGLPVVCTPPAAAGIDIEDGKHLVVAGRENEFADHVIRLLNDPDERTRLGTQARRLVESRYNWGQVMSPMIDLLVPAQTHAAASAPAPALST